jgi:hypothetical protein
MRSRTSLVVVGCALAAVTLAGCKSSTSVAGSRPTQPAASPSTPAVASPSTAAASASPSAVASTSASAAATGGSGTVADGLGHPVDVCSLLPVATVAQFSGEPITVAKEENLGTPETYTCAYTDSIGTSNVAVTVLALNAATTYSVGVSAFGSDATPIIGVGDKAYFADNNTQALFGNVLVTVTGLSSSADAVKIIQALQPKL